jgi:hypothetical protein
MRRLAPVLALAAVMAIAGTAVAKQPSKLQTFGTGDVTTAGWSATLDNGSGEYSGVYLKSKSLSAKRLRAVHISFTYAGTTAGGAPRFSIPIDTRDGATERYAFIDALNCGTSNTVGTDVSSCQVFLNWTSTSYANWHAFAAANQTWRLPRRAIPFIIADQPGHYEISNIDLR